LIVTDSITEDVRTALVVWLDDRPRTLGSYLATLIHCPWCMSVWVSAVVVPLAWFHYQNPAVLVPALILSASQVAGMTSSIGR
jgi:hypothetical protein